MAPYLFNVVALVVVCDKEVVSGQKAKPPEQPAPKGGPHRKLEEAPTYADGESERSYPKRLEERMFEIKQWLLHAAPSYSAPVFAPVM